MAEGRMTVEASQILKNLDTESLEQMVAFGNSKFFTIFTLICEKYAKSKKSEILSFSTEDERKLANAVSRCQGEIYSLAVMIEVVRGAQKELNKREGK